MSNTQNRNTKTSVAQRGRLKHTARHVCPSQGKTVNKKSKIFISECRQAGGTSSKKQKEEKKEEESNYYERISVTGKPTPNKSPSSGGG